MSCSETEEALDEGLKEWIGEEGLADSGGMRNYMLDCGDALGTLCNESSVVPAATWREKGTDHVQQPWPRHRATGHQAMA